MDKSKLAMIVGAALLVVLIGLSAANLIMMSSVMKDVKASEEQKDKGDNDSGFIPLSQTTSFTMTEPVVAVLKYDKEPDASLSVSITLGFRLDKKNEKSTSDLALLTENEGIISDRITKMLKAKSAEEFESEGFDERFQKEILQVVSDELLGTDSLVEVYFEKSISSKR